MKKFIVRLLFHFTWYIAILSSAAHAMSWTTTTANFKLKPGSVEQSGTFAFKNSSSETVQIRQVVPSCDCLVITSFPPKMEAGQSGSIHFTYRAKGREGVQTAKITVVSSDSALPQMLNLVLNICPAVTVGPGLLLWEKARQVQSVQITINAPDVKLDSHIDTSKEFSAKLTTLKPGISYRLNITPPPTKTEEGWATITFKDATGGTIQKKIRLVAN